MWIVVSIPVMIAVSMLPKAKARRLCIGGAVVFTILLFLTPLVGQEVTTATVAALLTILGFSLYDTIIVFDRIRENVPRMPRATFSQMRWDSRRFRPPGTGVPSLTEDGSTPCFQSSLTLASARWMGKGDKESADFAACDFAYLRHFYATGEKRAFRSFWREGSPPLEARPIPAAASPVLR